MAEIRPLGQIITFYSYKGGTGRSMTLANVACLLAERADLTPGKGVLMMDWDLEAPGLHRYFCDKLIPRKRAVDSRGTGQCDAEPGLIDLFYDLDRRIDKLGTSSATHEMFSEETARRILEETDLDKYIIPTSINNLSLIKAGRFNPNDTNEYPERVNKFSWESLYRKSPQLMRVFAELLSERYDYVLIDSRTGITDISGVCTMLLPEKLVVVFTPNMQSLMGVVDVVRRATDYRMESDDLRPLIIFPLVSRVESNEPDLRFDWRFGNAERNITGYQPEFEKVLAESYRTKDLSLDKYFDEMQIQHIPRYAYGEEIAVLVEKTEDKFSLRRSYGAFASKLIEPGLPWERLYVSVGQFETIRPSPVALGQSRTATMQALLYLGAGAVVFAVVSLMIAIVFQFSSSTSQGPASSNSANTVRPWSPVDGKLPQAFDRLYVGTVAGQGFAFALKREGAVLWGSASTNKAIDRLVGTIEEDGNFRLNSINYVDVPNGVYSGRIDRNGSVEGIWIDSLGTKRSPFSLAMNQGISAIVNSPADGFLALRARPSSKIGGKIREIPNGSKVIITNCDDYSETGVGKRSRWCVAHYDGDTGWILDLYITYGPLANDADAPPAGP